MSDNNIAVRVTGLTKQYKMYPSKRARLLETLFPKYQNHKPFFAVRDLDLTIEKGEILGILGQNGAGKSTLLKMITGVVTPTEGEIEVNGILSSLLELGTAFNSELTGIENIYQHGQVFGLSNAQIEERLPGIIEFANIGDHIYQQVKTYSSGMFARLAFACAINIDPEILIVDEVLSVGDIRFQMKCYNKFAEFKEQGKTILFVTHNISDILRNCTRAIIMSEGRVILDGDVREVVDEYKKLMVGIDITDKEKKREEERDRMEREADSHFVRRQAEKPDKGRKWKAYYPQPPKMVAYGNGKAEIADFGVFSGRSDEPVPNVDNDEVVTIKMKVKFHDDVTEPIFAVAIKDLKGLEVAGANTLVYHVHTGAYKKGDEAVVSFRQVIPVVSGPYSLSFGCTKFDAMGELEVMDRKYDAILVDVIADRESLGFMDMKSEIEIER